jgi:hypothetical protein
MARIEHVELDALRRGMPVMTGAREFGRLEEVIPQPDRRHALRLITRRAADGRLVEVPIEWVDDVDNGRIVLALDEHELSRLPQYIPEIPASSQRQTREEQGGAQR